MSRKKITFIQQIPFSDAANSPSFSRARIRTACLQCRERKARCSGTKPRCLSCQKDGRVCQWPRPTKRQKQKAVRTESPAKDMTSPPTILTSLPDTTFPSDMNISPTSLPDGNFPSLMNITTSPQIPGSEDIDALSPTLEELLAASTVTRIERDSDPEYVKIYYVSGSCPRAHLLMSRCDTSVRLQFIPASIESASNYETKQWYHGGR